MKQSVVTTFDRTRIRWAWLIALIATILFAPGAFAQQSAPANQKEAPKPGAATPRAPAQPPSQKPDPAWIYPDVTTWQWDGDNIFNVNAGYVGVGTQTPEYQLDVLSPSGDIARFGSADGNARVLITAPTGFSANLTLLQGSLPKWSIGNMANNNRLAIKDSDEVERFTIAEGGKVGVNTASPAFSLDVQGGKVNGSQGLCIAGDCKTAWSQVGGGGSQWTTNGANIHYSSGNVGVGTATPGERLVTIGNVLGGNITSHTPLYSGYDSQNNVIMELGYGTAAASDVPLASLVLSKNLTSANAAVGVLSFANRSIADGSEKRVSAISSLTDGATNSGLLAFNTTSGGTLAERMRITSAGRIGIGTTSPGTPLTVAADANAMTFRAWRNGNAVGWGVVGLRLALNNSSGAVTDYAGINAVIVNNTASAEDGALGFWTTKAGTMSERLRLDKDGNVGIGTTAPSAVLDVRNSDGLFYAGFGYGANKESFVRAGNASTGIMHIGDLNTSKTLLQENAGNVGIGMATPLYKLDVNGGTNGFRAKAASASGGDTIASFENSSGIQAIVRANGNVGIGTSSPTSLLHLQKQGDHAYLEIGAPLAFQSSISFSDDTNGRDIVLYRPENTRDFSIYTAAASRVLTVSQAGNVGIGAATPTERLEVAGNLKLTGTGNITAAGNLTVAGTINARYQDVAEWVESSQLLPAGTVVVLDQTKSNQVVASSEAYDTRVAGVISLQPGIMLGEKGDSKVLVATTGRVKVKVDATSAPIHVGDLLVTSDITGVAKKSEPLMLGGVQIHRPGTLIGKALEPLAGGTGEILVLLSLQ